MRSTFLIMVLASKDGFYVFINRKVSKTNVDLDRKYRYNSLNNGKYIVIITLTFRATSRVLSYIPTMHRHQKNKKYSCWRNPE